MLRRGFADRFQRHGPAAEDFPDGNQALFAIHSFILSCASDKTVAADDVTVHGFAPWSVDSIQSFDESMRQSDGSAFLPSEFDALLVSPSFRGASFQSPRRRLPVRRRSGLDRCEVVDLRARVRTRYLRREIAGIFPVFWV